MTSPPPVHFSALPIEADGLTLRVMTEADAPAVQASRVHPDNERYNGWRPATMDEVARYARQQDPSTIAASVGVVQLVIEEDAGDGSRRFVGDFGVQTRDPLPTVELGIALEPEAKGRGIATRASRLLTDALFEAGVHRVAARVDPRNEPSLRLFERLGFRREGHERLSYWDDAYAEWSDEVLFAILRSEWPAR
jgi:RimJ/RimL family protein N-acetyltransferase